MLSRAMAGLMVCLLAALTACTAAAPARELLTFDKDLYAKILENKAGTGQPVPLRSLTAFEWDAVYCYGDAAAADTINEQTGHIILDPGTRFSGSASLAVFVKGDTVVKVTMIPELSMTPGRQPDGVMLDGNVLKGPDQVSPSPSSSPAPPRCAPGLSVCSMVQAASSSKPDRRS